MARIFCGVMGDARGHVMRARCLTELMAGHEFLFAGAGRARELRGTGYRLVELPLMATRYARGRIDPLTTALGAACALAAAPRALGRLTAEMRAFDPDLVVSDYEFLTPLAAHRLGRPCISLGNQHVLTHCAYIRPRGHRLAEMLARTSVRGLYSRADRYLVTLFFPATPLLAERTEVFGPLVRPAVGAQRRHDGEHILAYQTTPHLETVLRALERQPRSVRVYGASPRPAAPHIDFRHESEQGFLADLASCAYALCNGGHGVVSEALQLGKPVIALPLGLTYEQQLNAEQIARLGFGECWTPRPARADAFERFESRLPEYRQRVRARSFADNDRIVARLLALAGERRAGFRERT